MKTFSLSFGLWLLSSLLAPSVAHCEDKKPETESSSLNNKRENWSDFESDGGMGDGQFDQEDEDEEVPPTVTPAPK